MPASRETHIVIPAAGVSRRMRSAGPKALVKLGQETILSRQLRLLNEVLPGAWTGVVAGFGSERVRRQLPGRCRLILNPDYAETNVAYSIALGLSDAPPGRVLVVYGDLVFEPHLLADLLAAPGSAVLFDLPRPGQKQLASKVGVTVVEGQITRFAYGLPAKWVQMVVLAEPERKRFEEFALHPDCRRYYAWEVLNAIIEQGGCFQAVTSRGQFAEVDSNRDIKSAEKLIANA